jgi:CheY-like chemotaxis protein
MTAINSILLIDDDQDDKYFFSMALEDVDPEVQLYTASDGNDALEKLKFITPDVILLDLIMPGMNGATFLKTIKKNPLLAHIPVIIYTTSLSIFDENEVLKLGAFNIYIKPVNLPDTIATIGEILNSFEKKRIA